MSQTISPMKQLTDEEWMDWQSRRYGNQVCQVQLLPSGRFLVSVDDHQFFAVVADRELADAVREVNARPEPHYTPPKVHQPRRKGEAPVTLSEDEIASILKIMDEVSEIEVKV